MPACVVMVCVNKAGLWLTHVCVMMRCLQANALAEAARIHTASGNLSLAIDSLTHAILTHRASTNNATNPAEALDVTEWTMWLGEALYESER